MTNQNQGLVRIEEGLVKINEISYDPNLFLSHTTNTHLDHIFSTKGGIPKATNWMIVGDPGVGKSTVMLSAITNAEETGSRVCFVSAEMSRVDMFLYVERYPKFGNIDIFFTGEHSEGNLKQQLEELFAVGYDLILLDSFVEVQDDVKAACNISTGQAEKWLLDLMYSHNMGNNRSNRYTTFLNIQQVTKGGNFVGSNKLKHLTTGMMEIRFEDIDDPDLGRFLIFVKNRRGHVGKKLYFDLSGTGDVSYDWERFQKSEKMEELRKEEKAKIKSEGHHFDKLFGVGKKEKSIDQTVEDILNDEHDREFQEAEVVEEEIIFNEDKTPAERALIIDQAIDQSNVVYINTTYTEREMITQSAAELLQICKDLKIKVPEKGANTNKKLRLLLVGKPKITKKHIINEKK
jgi:RecA/RadA recombinase